MIIYGWNFRRQESSSRKQDMFVTQAELFYFATGFYFLQKGSYSQ